MQLDQPEKAKWYLFEALERDEENIQTLEALVNYYEKEGHYPKVIMFYQELLELQPKNKHYRQKLGESYQQVGNEKEAEKWFKKAEEYKKQKK